MCKLIITHEHDSGGIEGNILVTLLHILPPPYYALHNPQSVILWQALQSKSYTF